MQLLETLHIGTASRLLIRIFGLALLVAGISACSRPAPETPLQAPKEYLEGALVWMQAHAVGAAKVDWAAVRRDGLALAADPKTTADTYPVLRLAIARLNDGNAFLGLPKATGFPTGLTARYPDAVVVIVDAGGPAELAGVQVGDVIQAINGAPPRPYDGNPASYGLDFGTTQQLTLTLMRPGESQARVVTVDLAAGAGNDPGGKPTGRLLPGTRGIAYVELALDVGSEGYPGRVQQLMRQVDRAPACGWVIDLRRNGGGDIWSYLAALGPLLGDGDLGGFVYPNNTRDTWGYHGGKVVWNKDERPESRVDGGIYHPRQPAAPVALLTGSGTIGAGELVVIAFRGRTGVRVFGEPTRGMATLLDNTRLSDGASIYVSGAYATDRAGKVYDRPIQPDQAVITDWTQFGGDGDPVIAAAATWLAAEPGCSR